MGHFADIDLPTVIHSREWKSLCDELVTCPFMLIQEFYSNMHKIDRFVPLFVTRVRGVSILVTPQLVADELRVPRIDFPDYPCCECLRTMSKDACPLSVSVLRSGVSASSLTVRPLLKAHGF